MTVVESLVITTEESNLTDPVVLLPWTSLKWPHIPEEFAFPDPLKDL